MSYYQLFKNWTEGRLLPPSQCGRNHTLLVLEDDAVFGDALLPHVSSALRLLPPNFSILNLDPKPGFCTQLLTRVAVWDWLTPQVRGWVGGR